MDDRHSIDPIRMTPTSISGGISVASGGVESPSEGPMFSFSWTSSLKKIRRRYFGADMHGIK
jgi:hypothetical protein